MLYQPISINDWSGGIADSAYKGIAGSHFEMVGLDIHSEPGIVQVQNKMFDPGNPIKGKIRWFKASTATECYALAGITASPQLYKSTDSGTTWTQKYPSKDFSTGNGNGFTIWRGYLFIAGDSKLDIYNASTDSDLIGWKTFTDDQGTTISDDYHPMWTGERDGSLYIGNKNYIALLTEVSGTVFNPNNTATYTWNSYALDIPPDFRIRSIEEIGNHLMLGCWRTIWSNAIDGYTQTMVAIIYPWNYVLRPQSHEGPISIRRIKGVSAMLNINDSLYAWVGTRGEIFYYNGSKLIKLKRVPDYITDVVEPGAVVSNFNDVPLFGLENPTTGGGGVYSFGSHNEKYPLALNLEYPLSPGQDVNYLVGAVGVIGATDNILLAGWKSGSTYGIDILNTAVRYASAYFVTRLMRVATAKDKAIIDGFQIFLDQPLAASQSINIKYRRNTGASWTTVKLGNNAKTMDYSEIGAKSEIYVPFKINDVVNLQLRVEFTVATDNNNTSKLREIMIR